MTDDYRVKSRSNAEVRALAKKAREFFGVAEHRYVDILACLRRETIWTVKGDWPLKFKVRPDSEMGPHDGLTVITDGAVNISVKESVADRGFFGDGRSRNTLAHELGHGVMWHDGAPMARHAMGNVSPRWLQSFESAEHQARVFAPAFLINDSIVSTLSTAEDISAEFGISLESAGIVLKELIADRDRAENAERMLQIAKEFRRLVEPPKSQIRFLSEVCSVCRNQILFPLGTKIMCQTCDTVFDRFQDGDSLSE